MENEPNPFVRMVHGFINLLDGPVTLFREKIVEPNQQKYPWYHQQFRRVPTIETCHEHDLACYYEANSQFQRDKLVDEEIVYLLRNRYEECGWYHYEDKQEMCADILKTYQDTATAYFIKYGDLGMKCDVVHAFMKQKHRMVWERRNGPVGSGLKGKYAIV